MQKSPIGVPIHTNVGFQVAKVAVGGRFGSNGQEVGKRRRAALGGFMGGFLPHSPTSTNGRFFH